MTDVQGDNASPESPKPPTGRRPIRRPLKYMGLFLLALFLLLALGGALIQTHTVKNLIARQVGSTVSPLIGFELELTGLRGTLPFQLKLEQLRLADAEGEFLALKDLDFSLSARALLRGMVQVNHLRVAEINLDRTPVTEAKPEEPPKERFEIPEIPELPRWIAVNELAIDQITLGQPVMELIGLENEGAPNEARFVLTGYLNQGGQEPGWDARLDIERLDAKTTDLNFQAGMPAEELQIALNFSDSAIVPALLQVEDALNLTLEGESQGSSWSGATAMTLGEDTLLDGDIALQLPGDGLGFDIALRAVLAHTLFPEAMAAHLGPEANLKLAGKLGEDRQLLINQLNLDSERAAVKGEGYMNLNNQALDFQVQLDHHDLQPYLADMDTQSGEGPLPLDVLLTLSGNLEDLSVKIESYLAEAEMLNGAFQVQLAETIGASGELHALPPARLLPEEVLELLEEGATLNLDVQYHRDGLLNANTVTLHGAGLDLALDGKLHTREPIADLTWNGKLSDATPYGALLGMELSGAVTLEGGLNGNAEASQLTLVVQGNDLAYTAYQLNALDLSVDGVAGAWPDALLESWEMNVDGDANGVQLAEAPLDRFQLHAALGGTALEHIQVDSFSLNNDNLEVTAQGDWRAGDAESLIETTLHIADLAPWSALAEQNITGALNLSGQIQSAPDTLARITMQANGAQLAGLPEPADALVGGTPALEAALQFHDGVLTLDSVDAQLAQGAIHVAGWVDTAAESLELNTTLDFANLDLALAPEDRLTGALSGQIEARGNFDALALSGEINGDALGMEAFHADQLSLQVAMEGLPKQLQGRITYDMTSEGVPFSMESLFDSTLPEIHIPRFRIAAPDNQLAGSMQWNLDTQQGQGLVDVGLTDLAVFEAFTQLPIAGAIQGDLALEATETQATLNGDLNLTALDTPWAQAEDATLMLRAYDLFDTPQGELTLQANAIQVDEIRWNTLELQADGDTAGIAFRTKGEGDYQSLIPHRMEANGQVQLGEAMTTVVEEMEFVFDNRPFTLEAPMHLEMADGNLRLEPMRLNLAGGTLEARMLQTADNVDILLVLDSLPLDLLQSFGQTPLEGLVHATLQIQGDPAAPTANMNIEVADLRKPEGDVNAPPLHVKLESRLAEGVWDATLSGTAADALNLSGEGTGPLNFALAPFALEAPEDGAMALRLDADMDLATLPAMGGIEEHVLEGVSKLWVTVEGPVRDPEILGEIALTEGRYENIETGTILEAIDLLIEAQSEQITLTRFTANDGSGGSLQGEGVLEVNPEAHFPFTMDFQTNEARLVHRDDVTAQSDSQLHVAGNTNEINVTGDMRIGPADITLPERLPPSSMVVVDVEEVNRSADWEAPPGIQPADAGSGPAINLDIQTQIPNRVFVRGPGLESEWNGQLHVLGSAADPRIQGQLGVMRGHLDFLGRRFEFAESIISFDANTPPAPFLNVLATADADDIEARLRITGPFDALKIELESEPYLPQDEILARVMFGRNLSEISPMQALQLARYATMLRGNVGGLELLSAGGGGGRMPGVDRFDFTRGASAEESTVGIGKYLSDEVYIEFVQGLSPESSKATVNVDLTPQIKLEGEVSAGAHSGVGIFWKRDY